MTAIRATEKSVGNVMQITTPPELRIISFQPDTTQKL